MEQFRFSNFSLKVLQPLPDIQKEIQLAGLLLRGPFPHHYGAISIFEIQFEGATTTSRYPKGIFEIQLAGLLLTAPLPDLHRAFSIFEIQFAGATTTSRYIQKEFSKFRLQVNSLKVHSHMSIKQFRFLKFSL